MHTHKYLYKMKIWVNNNDNNYSHTIKSNITYVKVLNHAQNFSKT